MRKALNNKVTKALREEAMSETLREALVDWQLQMDVSEDTRERAEALQLALLSEMEDSNQFIMTANYLLNVRSGCWLGL
ncbi:Undefined function [Listeria monocytogenes N53-1]|nr:Undefined function [Listeria monocytogenes N53-1]